jgi:hypothetical protein
MSEQQEQQGVGWNMQIEIHETVKQHPAQATDRADVKSAREMPLLCRVTGLGLAK